MHITELRLISFKGFRDFIVPCSQFTCLAGPNNGGKTSILQAIRLLFDIVRFAFGNKDRPDFTNVRWQANPDESLRRLSFGDPDAVWLKRKTSEPCKIEASLNDRTVVRLEISGPRKYQLDVIIDGDTISGKEITSGTSRLIESLFDFKPEYVPPVGAVTPREQILFYPQFRQTVDQGRSSECWRSYLYWLYNDGRSDEFDRILERVSRYLPDVEVQQPQLTHGNPPEVLVQFLEDNVLLDISTSGGGLRTLFNLAVVLELADSRCLLLDEPDAHLHGTLQRVISLMLADHSDEFDTQVIVASHAPDFLAEAPLECLRWVDRRAEAARPCDGLGEVLTNLGAISNADAIRVSGADKVLFVEGGFDHSLMSALFEKSGKANPFSDSTIIVARLPSGKGSVTHLQAFRHLLRETFHLHIKVAVVTDRDYQLDQEEPAHTEVLVATLERKEAENYLLNPSVIAGAMKSVAKKRFAKTREPINAPDEGEVASKLDEIVLTSSVRDTLKFQVLPRYRETLDAGFDQSTKEKLGDEWWSKQWSDSTWRINMCPGKKVLAEMRKWSQSTFGITLTRGELMSAVTDCPEEIAKIAENIERHFSGK